MLDYQFCRAKHCFVFESKFLANCNSGDNDIGGEGNKVTEARIAQARLSINNVKKVILSNETFNTYVSKWNVTDIFSV